MDMTEEALFCGDIVSAEGLTKQPASETHKGFAGGYAFLGGYVTDDGETVSGGGESWKLVGDGHVKTGRLRRVRRAEGRYWMDVVVSGVEVAAAWR